MKPLAFRSSSKHKSASKLPLLLSFVLGFLTAVLIMVQLLDGTTVHQRALRYEEGAILASVSSADIVAASSRPTEDGWKPIHVFYGERGHLEGATSLINKTAFRSNTFFAQVGQDQVVLNLFRQKRGGYFVDLAANDAVRFSNTYALETHYGWDGLCIEPSAVYWPSLSYRRCQVVAAVAGGDRERVDFLFSTGKKGVFGGIVGDQYDNQNSSKLIEGWTEPRLTVTLDDILRRFSAPKEVDYFSLDVEGAEGLVLTQSVLNRYTFKVMSLERPKKELLELLANNGYIKVRTLSKWGETLWAHQSALRELDLSEANLVSKQ